VDQWLKLAFSKGTNRAGVSLPPPEAGNRCSFRNAVSRYLECRKGDKVHDPNDSECYTPSSENFKFNKHDISLKLFDLFCSFILKNKYVTFPKNEGTKIMFLLKNTFQNLLYLVLGNPLLSYAGVCSNKDHSLKRVNTQSSTECWTAEHSVAQHNLDVHLSGTRTRPRPTRPSII
jgi:hypothetical protein